MVSEGAVVKFPILEIEPVGPTGKVVLLPGTPVGIPEGVEDPVGPNVKVVLLPRNPVGVIEGLLEVKFPTPELGVTVSEGVE